MKIINIVACSLFALVSSVATINIQRTTDKLSVLRKCQGSDCKTDAVELAEECQTYNEPCSDSDRNCCPIEETNLVCNGYVCECDSSMAWDFELELCVMKDIENDYTGEITAVILGLVCVFIGVLGIILYFWRKLRDYCLKKFCHRKTQGGENEISIPSRNQVSPSAPPLNVSGAQKMPMPMPAIPQSQYLPPRHNQVTHPQPPSNDVKKTDQGVNYGWMKVTS